MRFAGSPSGWVLGLAAALASLVPPGIEIAICSSGGTALTVRAAGWVQDGCPCCTCCGVPTSPSGPVATDAGGGCGDCCSSIPLPSGTQSPAPAPRASSPVEGALAPPPAASLLPAIHVRPIPSTGPPGDAGPVPAVFPLPLRV